MPEQTPKPPNPTRETAGGFSFNRRVAVFTAVWTMGILVLFGFTWRLWVGASDFPQVPLLGSLTGAPLLADWIALTLTLISASVLMIQSTRSVFQPKPSSGPKFVRIAALLFAVSILCLFLLNQHRLQPWAWQFFLYAVVLILANQSRALIVSARWLTVSIYFFSAISKFDYQFIYGLGGRMAQALAEVVGVEAFEGMSYIAAVMPVFELLVAASLIAGSTRKTGVVLAAIFHTALVATLGPWGLDHHTGVLVWNVVFFLIAAILFWPSASEDRQSAIGGPNALLFAATIVMVLYPLLPHCDHWLAWGLYSPNNSRSTLETIEESAEGEAIFQRVDLNKMSLEKLNVPIYPSARFQLGVARAIQERENLDNRSRIIIKSMSNRFTGSRDSTVFGAQQPWNKNKRTFFFNWKPRRK